MVAAVEVVVTSTEEAVVCTVLEVVTCVMSHSRNKNIIWCAYLERSRLGHSGYSFMDS